MKIRHEQCEPRETRSPQASESRAPETPEVPDALRDNRFFALYRDASYYSAGRNWGDYAPAYRFGDEAFKRYPGKRFDSVEQKLEQEWDAARGQSRLVWVEARGAVLDAWRQARLEARSRRHGIAHADIADEQVVARKNLHS
jgi:hypothetical protein